MGITNFTERNIMDLVFGGVAYAPPTVIYFALSTTTPLDDGANFSEPNAIGGYARVQRINDMVTWTPTDATGKISTTMLFGPSMSAWGTITHVGIFDAPVGGNLLATAPLSNALAINKPYLRISLEFKLFDEYAAETPPFMYPHATISAVATLTALPVVTRPGPAGGAWYISPIGSTVSAGSEFDPWNISVLKDGGYPAGCIHAGDTVYLMEGVYGTGGASHIDVKIRTGVLGNPVTVRPYPNSAVRINGSLWLGTDDTASNCSTYTIVTNAQGCELEIFNDDWHVVDAGVTKAGRILTTYTAEANVIPRPGVEFKGAVGCEIRNAVVHDCFHGVRNLQTAQNCHAYGMLTYNNGVLDSTKGIGSGLTVANTATFPTPLKNIKENLSVNNLSLGVEMHDQDQCDYSVQGNIVLNNAVSYYTQTGQQKTTVFDANHFIARGREYALSTVKGMDGSNIASNALGLTLTNNRLILLSAALDTHYPLMFWNYSAACAITGNTLINNARDGMVMLKKNVGTAYATHTWNTNHYRSLGGSAGMDFRVYDTGAGVNTNLVYDFPAWKTLTGYDAAGDANTGLPGAGEIIVRPNLYEVGRGHIIAYNWTGADSINVDLSGLGYQVGDIVQLRNASNYFGDIPIQFIYDPTVPAQSTAVPVDMTVDRWTVSPLDQCTNADLDSFVSGGAVDSWRPFAVNTFPLIGCFVVRKVGASSASTTKWYASPLGQNTNDGSFSSPWDLATALQGGYPANSVKPGHTVFLKSGQYGAGSAYLKCTLMGASGNNIIVTPEPGAHVRLCYGIDMRCAYVRFQGNRKALFEIFDPSWTQRVFDVTPPQFTAFRFPSTIDATLGVGCSFHNLYIHDTAGGIHLSETSQHCGVRGCIMLNIGYAMTDGSVVGEGVQFHNEMGWLETQHIVGNIISQGFHHGIMAYSYDGEVSHLDVTDNFFVNSSVILYSETGSAHNIDFVGNFVLGQNVFRARSGHTSILMTAMHIYNNRFLDWGTAERPISIGACDATSDFSANTVVSDRNLNMLLLRQAITPFTMQFNNNYWASSGIMNFRTYNWSSNTITDYTQTTWKSATPVSWELNTIFRSSWPNLSAEYKWYVNPYERGRGNLAIINWPGSSSIPVDFSGLGLINGDVVYVRNAVSPYTDAPITFVYNSAVPAQSTAVSLNLAASRWTYDRPLMATDAIRESWDTDYWGSKMDNQFPEYCTFLVRVEE